MIPQNEMGVIILFAEQSTSTGFKAVEIGAAYPDAIIEKNGARYRAEFEFMASNFRDHRHDPRDADIIICWENDYLQSPLPVLALSEDDWHTKEIILPTEIERELAYWKQRATIAENTVRTIKNKLAMGKQPNSIITESPRLDALLSKIAQSTDDKPFSVSQGMGWAAISRKQFYNLVEYAQQRGHIKQVGRGLYSYTNGITDYEPA